MELKEKISLLLKAALEYNSAIVCASVIFYQTPTPGRQERREFIKKLRKLQTDYMKQLDQILTAVEKEEAEVS